MLCHGMQQKMVDIGPVMAHVARRATEQRSIERRTQLLRLVKIAELDTTKIDRLMLTVLMAGLDRPGDVFVPQLTVEPS